MRSWRADHGFAKAPNLNSAQARYREISFLWAQSPSIDINCLISSSQVTLCNCESRLPEYWNQPRGRLRSQSWSQEPLDVASQQDGVQNTATIFSLYCHVALATQRVVRTSVCRACACCAKVRRRLGCRRSEQMATSPQGFLQLLISPQSMCSIHILKILILLSRVAL